MASLWKFTSVNFLKVVKSTRLGVENHFTQVNFTAIYPGDSGDRETTA